MSVLVIEIITLCYLCIYFYGHKRQPLYAYRLVTAVNEQVHMYMHIRMAPFSCG